MLKRPTLYLFIGLISLVLLGNAPAWGQTNIITISSPSNGSVTAQNGGQGFPGGYICPTTCSDTYFTGSAEVLTAQPNATYEFDHWIVNGSNNFSNPLNLTVSIDYNISVVFALDTPTNTPTDTPT